MSDINHREIDRLKLTAFLRKMAELEKENGHVSDQETRFWSEPENLQRLATEFWNQIQVRFNRLMRWSTYMLAIILLAVGYVRITSTEHRNLIFKTLLLTCCTCTLLMAITTVDWIYEGFPEKYWFQISLVTIGFGLIIWGICNMLGAAL